MWPGIFLTLGWLGCSSQSGGDAGPDSGNQTGGAAGGGSGGSYSTGGALTAVIVYDNRTYNVYHALAAPSGQNGNATLRIAEIAWDANGWPVSGGP